MKSFKPEDSEAQCRIVSKNDDELFLDIKLFELYKKAVITIWDELRYDWMMSGLGKTVLVFDVDSCEFFERKGNG